MANSLMYVTNVSKQHEIPARVAMYMTINCKKSDCINCVNSIQYQYEIFKTL